MAARVPTDEAPVIDLRELAMGLRKRWKSILLLGLIGMLLGALVSALLPKEYSARSVGLVNVRSDSTVGTQLAADNLAISRAQAYATVAQSRRVAEDVVKELELDMDAGEASSRVTVEVPEKTAELRVMARAAEPQDARDLADAWVRVVSRTVDELNKPVQSPSGQPQVTGSPTMEITLVPLEQASLPGAPTSPNTRLNVAAGLLLGLLLGLAIALVRNHLDRRITSASSVENALGIAVLGALPQDRAFDEEGRVLSGDSESERRRGRFDYAEGVRELRTNLSFVAVDHPPLAIAVTSSVPGEGKSSIAANLCVTMAASGRKTVLIDADLRRPVVAKTMGVVPDVGMTQVLSGEIDIEEALQQTEHEGVMVLAAGRIPPNPSELLASDALRRLIDHLTEDYFVVVDTPPLLAVTDAAVLSRAVDGILIAVRAGSTSLDELGRSVQALEKVGAKVLGVVLNRVPTRGAEARQYGNYRGNYYYYGDGSSKDGARKRSGNKRSRTSTDRPEGRRAQSRRART